ncbi:MAG: gamma-glutamylcyclotransferase family protein, partial [Luteolibacter sp.]
MVFVYGTLRRGGSNHFRMDGAEFITAGRIAGRMYKIDWYPGLVLD